MTAPVRLYIGDRGITAPLKTPSEEKRKPKGETKRLSLPSITEAPIPLIPSNLPAGATASSLFNVAPKINPLLS